jgi:hypothetical protein
VEGERTAILPGLGEYSRAARNLRSERLFLTNPRIEWAVAAPVSAACICSGRRVACNFL